MSRNDTHSVRFKDDLWKEMKEQAAKEERSVSSLVHFAVRVYLEKHTVRPASTYVKPNKEQ